jgi:hypothetical protein
MVSRRCLTSGGVGGAPGTAGGCKRCEPVGGAGGKKGVSLLLTRCERGRWGLGQRCCQGTREQLGQDAHKDVRQGGWELLGVRWGRRCQALAASLATAGSHRPSPPAPRIALLAVSRLGEWIHGSCSSSLRSTATMLKLMQAPRSRGRGCVMRETGHVASWVVPASTRSCELAAAKLLPCSLPTLLSLWMCRPASVCFAAAASLAAQCSTRAWACLP